MKVSEVSKLWILFGVVVSCWLLIFLMWICLDNKNIPEANNFENDLEQIGKNNCTKALNKKSKSVGETVANKNTDSVLV